MILCLRPCPLINDLAVQEIILMLFVKKCDDGSSDREKLVRVTFQSELFKPESVFKIFGDITPTVLLNKPDQRSLSFQKHTSV